MLPHQPFRVAEEEPERAFFEMEARHRSREGDDDSDSHPNESFSSSGSSACTLHIDVSGHEEHEPFYDTRNTKALVDAATRRHRPPAADDDMDGDANILAKPNKDSAKGLGKGAPSAATVGFAELLEAARRLNEEEERVTQQRERQRALEEEEAQALRNKKWEEVKARLSQRNTVTPMVSMRSKEWDDSEEEDDDLNDDSADHARATAPLIPRSRRNPYDPTIYDDPQDYAYRAQLTQRSTTSRDGTAAAGGETARSTALSINDPFANDEEKPMRKLMKREVVAPVTRAWRSVYNWGVYFVLALSYMPGVSLYEASKPDNYYQDTYYE